MVWPRKPNYTVAGIPLRFGSGQIIPMGYLDSLAALRKRKGLSQTALAEKVGVEQPTIQRWETGKREPDLTALHQLAAVLGVTPGMLLDGSTALFSGPKLFIKGEVAAGLWQEAYEWPPGDWQTFTGRSDVLADIEHRFGLLVNGDSMDEIYPPGTIIECVSAFGHTEIAPGKRVVILRIDTHGRCEATVKELVEQDGELWAVPRSSNPAHLPIRLNEEVPGIQETRVAAVVVSSVRPE